MRNKMKNHVLSVKSCEWNNFSVIYFVINVSSKWNLRTKEKWIILLKLKICEIFMFYKCVDMQICRYCFSATTTAIINYKLYLF